MGKSLRGSIFITIMLLAMLFECVSVLGQNLLAINSAFREHNIYRNEYTILDTPYKAKKWNGNNIGAGLMVIGFAAGGYAFVNAGIHGDLGLPNKSTFTPSQSLVNNSILVAGSGLALVGIELAHHYEEKHKTTVIISGNRVGFTYNFK